MIRLMPYSTHEIDAMNEFLSQMAKKKWQYHWRFLCFVRFKKEIGAKPLKCVLLKSQKSRLFPCVYHSDKLDNDIMLRPNNEDTTQNKVALAQLRETSIVRFVLFSMLIVAFGIFLVLCCAFNNWKSVNSLWGMRQMASLHLPFAICLAIDQVFLTVRLVKIRRFSKYRAPYIPCKSYIRYICFLLATILTFVQIVTCSNIRMNARQTEQYEAYISAVYADGMDENRSVFMNRFILEPESWESLLHVNGGDVRVAYHDCLTSIGAKNYFVQFQNDNKEVTQDCFEERGVQMCAASDENYYAIVFVYQNRVLIIAARYAEADSGAVSVHEIVEIIENTTSKASN